VSVDLTAESVRIFQEHIMDWWKTNSRDLPWRRDPSPYHVLISEVMLQQTQVNRVIPKYIEFLNIFPTLEDLASTDIKQVLQLWSGLGYNRRAIWLRDAARQIVESGRFPQTIEELKTLKGIGPYTSRSILIFAFNMDLAAVDTNIRRIFIAEGFAEERMTLEQLQKVAESLLLKGHSRDWHNALMDYGSEVLTASSSGISSISRQSKFSGSTRELRGVIIRLLTCTDSICLNDILGELEKEGITCRDVKGVLEKLISENLVERVNGREFKIAEC
jgi:A/G-specific adenine glycosylase